MLYNDNRLRERRKELRKNQTEAERIVWKMVKNRQCNNYKFYRQYSVGFYILDIYCPKLRLSIETDGGHHSQTKEYDQERTAYLSGQNIKELRFWNNEVMENPEGVYQKLLEYCK